MRRTILLLSIFLVSIITFTACKKSTLFAPTFVCYVDDEKFTPSKGGDMKFDPLKLYFNDTLFHAFAYNKEGYRVQIFLVDLNGISETNYYLADNSKSRGTFLLNYDLFETDSSNSGILLIEKIDKTEKKISGRFEFSAKEKNGTRVVEVRDGRFNLSYGGI